ncbi:hypothetical protein [Maribacter polysiphoniae]|nr:hypothetical protein [Maribacter polysiphoniae]
MNGLGNGGAQVLYFSPMGSHLRERIPSSTICTHYVVGLGNGWDGLP